MTYSARNEAMLTPLDPVARQVFRHFLFRLARIGEDVLVTDGYRTKAEQDSLYAQGRSKGGKIVTNVKHPYSFHNHGVAIDLVPVLFGQSKVLYNASARYNLIAQVASMLGIDWGFTMWGFDKPHFQYTQGLSIHQLIGGKTLNHSVIAKIKEDYKRELQNMKHALPRQRGKRRERLAEQIKYVESLIT
jgi:peptidoglycan LD-endopeptidase CwlK